MLIAAETVALIQRTGRAFIGWMFPSDARQFDKAWAELPVAHGHNAAILFAERKLRPCQRVAGLARTFEDENVEVAIWSVIGVLVRFQEEVAQGRAGSARSLSMSQVGAILQQCMQEAKTPSWLRPRIVTLMPGLVLKAAKALDLSGFVEDTEARYVKYCGLHKPESLSEAEVFQFRKSVDRTQFDLYMDDVPPSGDVALRGLTLGIRGVEFLPYRILRLLLTRVGHDVTYREIRDYLWSPFQLSRTRNTGRLIYEAVNRIREAIAERNNRFRLNAPEWIERTTVRGRIHISDKLNSCLLTSKDVLRPRSKR